MPNEELKKSPTQNYLHKNDFEPRNFELQLTSKNNQKPWVSRINFSKKVIIITGRKNSEAFLHFSSNYSK